MRRRLLYFLLLVPVLAPAVCADEEGDSARARAAAEAGEILPLAELLGRIESHYAGRVIETELDQEHGRWIYDFKFLPEAGHIFTVEVDAATGKVIRTRGPVQEQP